MVVITIAETNKTKQKLVMNLVTICIYIAHESMNHLGSFFPILAGFTHLSAFSCRSGKNSAKFVWVLFLFFTQLELGWLYSGLECPWLKQMSISPNDLLFSIRLG